MSDSVNPYQPSTSTSVEPRIAQGDFEALSGTATGLKIIYYGIVLGLLSVIGGIVVVATVPAAVGVLAILMVVAYLMLTVGPFFCLTAPEETGAKGLIIGSIVCQILVLVETALPWVGIDLSPLFSSLTSLVSLIGAVLFVLFMMKIARFIQRPDLHSSGRTILIGAIILFVVGIAGVMGIFFVGALAGILVMCAGIGTLVLFVMYANLVNQLANAIRTLQART